MIPTTLPPRDNLPWERLAINLLQRGLPEHGLGCVSPMAVVEEQVAWLVNHLKLPSGAAILDIGCGPGHYSRCLAQRGYQVTGLDIAPSFISYARAWAERAGLPGTFHNCSVFDLPLTQRYDAILMINSVLKQLTEDEFGAWLDKLKSIIKIGGSIIAEVSLCPKDFELTQPTVQEYLSLHQYSPWYDVFHAWLRRELIFPASNERVSHHLLLTDNGVPEEYWSRFVLHTPGTLARLLAGYHFHLKEIFGPALGQAYSGEGTTGFIWWIYS